MSMKPCKGCIYFRRGLMGPYCHYYVRMVTEVEPFSGESYRTVEGEVQASIMREPDGACGPDRKLYMTNWDALKQIVRSLISKMKREK